MINISIDVIGIVVSKVAFFVLIAVYISMGFKTNTEMIFYLLQLFNQLSKSFGNLLPENFSRIAQFSASVTRLDKVLHDGELQMFDNEEVEKPNITLKNVHFELGKKTILDSVTLSISKPGLTVVTGCVGSGKTSLLKIFARDYQPATKGEKLDVIHIIIMLIIHTVFFY